MKLDCRGRASGPRRAGFTLLELLAVIFVIAIVLGALLSMIHRARTRAGGSANGVKCASNLRQIGQAILYYSYSNKGAYPRTGYRPGAPLVFSNDPNDGSTVRNPFGENGLPGTVADNDMTAAMFLLLRTQDVTSEEFVCPSAGAERDTFGRVPGGVQMQTSFTDWRKNLSYSLANPYPSKASVDAGYRWNSTLTAEFAVAADVNPGVGGGYDVTAVSENSKAKDMQKANSPNHQGAGENVLYGDGHVEFQQNPFVGMKRDNIYTVAGGTPEVPTTTSTAVVGSPTWAGDSVMLPAAK